MYTDTSGVRRFDILEQAARRAGAGKILFGSDGPWLHPGVELAKVRALGFSPQEERKVVSGNILKLMRPAGEPVQLRPVVRAAARAPEQEARDPWETDPFAV